MIAKSILLFSSLFFFMSPAFGCNTKTVHLKVVQTSDVHGNFFPYDYSRKQAGSGSLARVYSYVKEQRQKFGKNLLLLDNGDILQGQPSVYYYNFMDTVSLHLCSEIMNFMRYDAGTMGNHDVETGHKVYDRWIKSCQFPILGANIIDTKTGKPYLQPYAVLNRNGVKIVILGMITPAIPAWLPENLWKGLRFDEIESTARKWMKIIQEKEKPDVVIGMFHSGKAGNMVLGKYSENASLQTAINVPGFDIVLMGHDHIQACTEVLNVNGDTVHILDPANNANVVSDIDIEVTLKGGKSVKKVITSRLGDTKRLDPDNEYMAQFSSQFETSKQFVSEKIGYFTKGISAREAFFGSSAFIDLIHQLQLEIGHAEISFAAPLSINAEIKEGDVHISDMFSLYKYENMLYTMDLTGKEIKGYLEESYAQWTNQMTSAADHIILFKQSGGNSRELFKNPSFNFDSAAGIRYTVDVTKPAGEKITIQSMADGSPFDYAKTYKVAVNSYRGNGGGELLTKGAGIPKSDLAKRICFATERDLRYYLIQYIKAAGTLSPKPLNQWQFIPQDWAKQAAQRDSVLLFSE